MGNILEVLVWPNYVQKIKINEIISDFNLAYRILLAEVKTKSTKKEMQEYIDTKKFSDNISNKFNDLRYKDIISEEVVSYFKNQMYNYLSGRSNSMPSFAELDFAIIRPKGVYVDYNSIEAGDLGKLMFTSKIVGKVTNVVSLSIYRIKTNYKVKVLYNDERKDEGSTVQKSTGRTRVKDVSNEETAE